MMTKRQYGEDRMVNLGFRATEEEVKLLDSIALAGGHRSRSSALRAMISEWNNPIAKQIEELQRLRSLIEKMSGVDHATVVSKLAKSRKVSSGGNATGKV